MMDVTMVEDQQHSFKFIRKLRKKLRQIERLETAQRELNEEEQVKVSRKHDFRETLQSLLSTLNESNVSLDTSKTDQETADGSEYELNSYGGDITNEVEIPDTTQTTADSRELTEDIISPDSCGDTEDLATHAADSYENSSPPASVPMSKLSDKGPKKIPQPTLKDKWKNVKCKIVELQGHNDHISCTDVYEGWAVSGSRDTTVKLWNCVSGEELKNMGGHTGHVTAVRVMDQDRSDNLRCEMDLSTVEVFADIKKRESENERIVVSGSADCSVRLWIVPSGLFVKSIYNYNPVSSLEYYGNAILVGSSSGNLSVYDLCSSIQLFSSILHDGLITSIKVCNHKIVTSSADGSIKVWNVAMRKASGDGPIKSKFSSDLEFDLKIQHSFDEHNEYVPYRMIQAFDMRDAEIYFGDDGCNMKVWKPLSGGYSKIRNHKPGVPGLTDGVCVEKDLLFSTSYDLDTGKGSINLRSLDNECHLEYITSFYEDDTPRMTSMSTLFNDKFQYVVSGGEKLTVWHLINGEARWIDTRLMFRIRNPARQVLHFPIPGRSTGEVVRPCLRCDWADDTPTIIGRKVKGLTRPAADSEVSSNDDDTSADEGSGWFWKNSMRKRKRSAPDNNDSSSTEMSEIPSAKPSKSVCDWCTII